MYLVISLLVLRAGCGIWLYQFLIIAYLFTTFIALVGPLAIFCVIRPYVFNNKPNHYFAVNRTEMLAYIVLNSVAYMNHSTNFIFYVLSWHRFRQDLMTTFRRVNFWQIHWTNIITVHFSNCIVFLSKRDSIKMHKIRNHLHGYGLQFSDILK